MAETESSSSRRSAWCHYLLVAAAALGMLLWRLGGEVMDDHECHLALASRRMARSARRPWLVKGVLKGTAYELPACSRLRAWLVPVENGRPRLVKTPLPYWCVALAARCGSGVTNFTARLPSAIAAVLCALVTLALGRRMFNARAALLGAVILITSLGFQKWGRKARPEMILCLLMTAAMASFYFGLHCRRRRGHVAWMAAFWVLMGLGNLAKQFVPLLLIWPLAAYLFWRQSSRASDDLTALRALRWFLIASAVGLALHVTIAMVPALHWWRAAGLDHGKGSYLTMAVTLGGPMVWLLLASRGWKQVLPLLPTAVVGSAVMLAMFVPWMAYMSRLFPSLAEAVLSHQVTARAAGSGGWTFELPHTYLLALGTLSLPWLALLPGAFAVGLMQRFHASRGGLVYLLLWSIGLIGLFAASAAKRDHYILPMLPAVCLLMGFVAEDVFFRHRWIRPGLSRFIGMCYGPVGFLAAAGLAVASQIAALRDLWGPALLSNMSLVSAVAGVPAAAAGLLAWRGRLRPVPGLIAAAMAIAAAGYYTLATSWDPRKPIRRFATAAAETIQETTPGVEVYHWHDPQAKLVFYFGRDIPAMQWSFQWDHARRLGKGRRLSNQDYRQAHANLMQWLRANPAAAPWMFGYEEKYNEKTGRIERLRGAGELAELGYKPVLTERGRQSRRYLFALYRRQAPVKPTAGPK